MTFFESLLALMAAAVLLLQVARRLRLPYPAMLAAAGVGVAMIPGAPTLPIAPATALALFIAPVLTDAAYDYPVGAARRLLRPLLVYAVLAVLLTAGGVAFLGVVELGLPIAVALTLGAIVAPPDAAAATAVLSNLPVERRVDAVLKGESLFNDATALLLFTAALTVHERGGLDFATGARLAVAVPGGIAFGVAYGLVALRINPLVENTVGGTLLQFLHSFGIWIIAEHLHLSAVLAVVASAMTIAAFASPRDSPRMRVHSYAVWTTVVFLLNVFAFLLMGMQARRIVATMDADALVRAGWFAASVVAGAIVVRVGIAFGYRWFVVRRHRRHGGKQPLAWGETFLIGWTGMRGLVTLATAFALPRDFPERDTLVLVAFAVVLATLVLQGLTLPLLIRLFGIRRDREARDERDHADAALADAALARLEGEAGPEADALRRFHAAGQGGGAGRGYDADRHLGLALAAILAQRERLEALRATHRIGPETYLALQEVLDWQQLAVVGEDDRRLHEG